MAVLWPYPEDAFHYSARVDREDADQSVADGVTARLLGHDGTGDQPIKVTVQNRVAILTGAVDSLDVAILAGDPERASQAARHHLGFVQTTLKNLHENEARQRRSTRLPDDDTDITRDENR